MEGGKEMLDNFFRHNYQQQAPKQIAIPQVGSILFIDVEQIVSLEAQNNYTIMDRRKQIWVASGSCLRIISMNLPNHRHTIG